MLVHSQNYELKLGTNILHDTDIYIKPLTSFTQ